jgi:hypothetical protein
MPTSRRRWIGRRRRSGDEFQRFFEADAKRLADGVRKVGRVEDKK